MAFQGTFFNNVRILPHDKYSGPFVGVAGAHPVECSRPVGHIHTAIWVVTADLRGLWCQNHNTFWFTGLGAGYPAQDFVLRFELEPSNGVCPCHGTSAAPWPLPDPNSVVAIEANGIKLAGHVNRTTAQQVSGCLLWPCHSVALSQ